MSMKGQRVSKGERSLPYKRPFVWVLVLDLAAVLAALGSAGCGVVLMIEGSSALMAGLCVGFLLVVLVLLAVGYPVRRAAKCPLCRGTPLVDSRASKHAHATRVPPLSHGLSARLGLMMVQRFRCMYCGTPYDLYKKPGESGRK
jgi:hypothetical protein